MTQSLIGSARPHESAALHVAGSAPYTTSCSRTPA